MGLEQLQLTGDRRLLCDEHADARAAQLAGFLRKGREGEQCEDCQEIAARPERRLLQMAIDQVEEFTGDGDSGYFIDPHCNECTEGLTPISHDRGPCWLHAAKRLLAGQVKTDAARKLELHAAVTSAILALGETEFEVSLEVAEAISKNANERLDALVDFRLI
jgi:hypothetical protein